MVKTAKTKAVRYFEAVGKRKSAIARVRLFKGGKNKGDIEINAKNSSSYFPIEELQEIIKGSLKKTGLEKEFYITVKVYGGGIRAQAEAVRLGISRALLKFKADLRQILKQEKFLKRDARVKERRKFGLKKARKAPQWSKR
jgi:small subunit ribosomal protein S9